ncbi:hypothetical protein NPIL_635731 [Nephila pilipes]|uniref:Uncharacterized protein n=1 Tax=Nephila pilipes TaxID=299642 RepID=A0A8X6IQR5_NEPPI|nr:hypothetical protein NPIL_635731 [Nephila pilipes]
MDRRALRHGPWGHAHCLSASDRRWRGVLGRKCRSFPFPPPLLRSSLPVSVVWLSCKGWTKSRQKANLGWTMKEILATSTKKRMG